MPESDAITKLVAKFFVKLPEKDPRPSWPLEISTSFYPAHAVFYSESICGELTMVVKPLPCLLGLVPFPPSI